MNSSLYFMLRDNTVFSRKYTWATSILPKSDVYHSECRMCGRVRSYPSGAFDVIVEGGAQYPDIMGCGAYPFLIVSERVVDIFLQEGVASFHAFPVNVAGVQAGRLRSVKPPRYVRVEVNGTCRLDLSELGVVNVCGACGGVAERPLLSDERAYVVRAGTWDGSHLFRDELHYPNVTFCTQRVRDIISTYHLTNFRLEPIAANSAS